MRGPTNFVDDALRTKREQLASSGLLLQRNGLRERALAARQGAKPRAFSDALRRPGRVHVIAEIKRASPSKATISADLEPRLIAKNYSDGGASAISVLTEEHYFRGSQKDLHEARAAVGIPIMRKDFIIDPCQIYETAAAGADAVSLVVSFLDDHTLKSLRHIAEDELGLDAMVEVHSLGDMRRAHASGATLIAVNNRSLTTFDVSLETSIELASKAPADVLLVSKGGLKTGKHLRALRTLGYKGFVVGEVLLRSGSAGEALQNLLQAAEL